MFEKFHTWVSWYWQCTDLRFSACAPTSIYVCCETSSPFGPYPWCTIVHDQITLYWQSMIQFKMKTIWIYICSLLQLQTMHYKPTKLINYYYSYIIHRIYIYVVSTVKRENNILVVRILKRIHFNNTVWIM